MIAIVVQHLVLVQLVDAGVPTLANQTPTLSLHFQNFFFFQNDSHRTMAGAKGWRSKKEKEKMENGSRLRRSLQG